MRSSYSAVWKVSVAVIVFASKCASKSGTWIEPSVLHRGSAWGRELDISPSASGSTSAVADRFSPVISFQGAAFWTICGNPLLILHQKSWSGLTDLSPVTASVFFPIIRGTSNYYFPHPEVLNAIFLNSISYLCLGQSQDSSLALSWVGLTVKKNSRWDERMV